MDDKYKFGIYKYQTENIGDNIQTIAALRFVPQVDYIFDRDNINATKIKSSDEVKLIMNGWYMHHRNGVFDWPPKSANLHPLLISMYLERDVDFNRADLAFFTDESRAFLEKFGPIGARDIGTQKFLEKNGIKAYFSGCLTLTLLPDESIPKRDCILAVDISEQLYDYITSKTPRSIVRMDTNIGSDLPNEDKSILAKYWLSLYQSAHCVVTSRLHAMLPSLALGTPVLAVQKDDPHRFEGLIDLLNHAPEKDIVSGKYAFDFDKPKSNPKTYQKYADKLARTCRDFTGYDSRKSFLGDQSYTDFINSPELVTAITELAARSHELVLARRQLDHVKAENESQKQELANCHARIDALEHSGIKQSARSLAAATMRRLKK